MLKQVQESDFVIVVCTETSARRLAADAGSRKGKGVRWEEGAILQCLHDEGENRRFIPVVLDHGDTSHIPPALKSATHYDLSTEAGYDDLHRALTNQPRIEKPTVGPVRQRLPDPTPDESKVTALLSQCPDPLHRDIVAAAIGQEVTDFDVTLQQLVRIGLLKIENDGVRLVGLTPDDIPAPTKDLLSSSLEAALDFVRDHPDSESRSQISNVVCLALAADISTAAVSVSRTFRSIQSFLKSAGDKQLVLRIARRSIEASRAPGRGPEQVKDEAVAAICGVSWVYQRTGRLSEALAEAERSLELGAAIRWDRNTAFCHKCLGRLKRMQAEASRDAKQRGILLADSVDLLRKAIQEFTALELEEEVGDCFSLLARTYLFAGNRLEARTAIGSAEERLVNEANKDYLDLQIVKGDLAWHVNRRSAESLYTEVVTGTGDDDAQRSEIKARAYLRRGQVRVALEEKDKALEDFRQAARIWDQLHDPTADFAHWEIARLGAKWMDRETEALLEREPVGVMVRAARIVSEATANRAPGRSYRGKLPRKYLRGAISRARAELATHQPAW